MNDKKHELALNRRKFLTGASAATLATGLYAQGSQAKSSDGPSTTTKTPFQYDCVVIGGGFAGVTAARELKKNHLNCLIVEARNRLGGRAFYAPFGDHKVELGGTWIHWTQPFIWSEVMRYGMDIVETPGASAQQIIQLQNNSATQLDLVELYNDLMTVGQALAFKARESWPRPYDTNFSKELIQSLDKYSVDDLLKYLDLTPSQHSLLESMLTGSMNANPKHVSANEVLRALSLCGYDMASFGDVSSRYHIKDGTSALIEKIVQDATADIRLNTIIRRIEQKKDHVILTTSDGETITAATAICTVPLNVLKDIEFSPAIHPHKLQASQEGHPGKGFKVYAEVKGKAPNVLLYGDKKSALDTVFTYHMGQSSSLLLAFGHDRSRFDIYDDQAMQMELQKFLPDIEVLSTFGYEWTLDPYSQGTWCTWAPGWASKYSEGLKDGPEGKIYFASSDFSDGNRGFIDGAIGSGIKIAQQVKEFINSNF